VLAGIPGFRTTSGRFSLSRPRVFPPLLLHARLPPATCLVDCHGDLCRDAAVELRAKTGFCDARWTKPATPCSQNLRRGGDNTCSQIDGAFGRRQRSASGGGGRNTRILRPNSVSCPIDQVLAQSVHKSIPERTRKASRVSHQANYPCNERTNVMKKWTRIAMIAVAAVALSAAPALAARHGGPGHPGRHHHPGIHKGHKFHHPHHRWHPRHRWGPGHRYMRPRPPWAFGPPVHPRFHRGPGWHHRHYRHFGPRYYRRPGIGIHTPGFGLHFRF
jgi:hypothetical protein